MQSKARKRAILGDANLAGLGLEIGPSHNPLLPKRKGYQVETLDHATREDLVEKYRDHGVDVDAIEEVDYIWRGEPYTELIGVDRYDYIVASHVIEHTVDFVSFINDCSALLKEGGLLCLAVPNKLYCFDYFRPVMPLAKFVDTHHNKQQHHTPGTAAEYYLNVVARGGNIAWSGLGPPEPFTFVHSLQNAKDGIAELSGSDPRYLDLHNWCFTPHHFLLIVQDLLQLGLITMGVKSYHIPREGLHEFYVQLADDSYQTFDRMNLQQLVLQETAQVYHSNIVSEPKSKTPRISPLARIKARLRRILR